MQDVGAISEEDRVMYERMARDVAVRSMPVFFNVYPRTCVVIVFLS
jgi:hypothetical protein